MEEKERTDEDLDDDFEVEDIYQEEMMSK